ncbi:MAG: tyrosine--tRNA ligase [Patescibacteria group bacterium]|jgi:tyrosyl-tRNA synthetase|nr:tyrosine--tRNA ligase [Patescibacteria group bacterium]
MIKISLADELKERGYIYQYSTDKLEDILNEKEKRTIYLGVDPTAGSIHVGHLVVYMLTYHLLQAGHKVILLIGGATALIGDPSGKDMERQFLKEDDVARNALSLTKQIEGLLKIDNIEMVNNYDWFSKMNVMEFLREVGKHFTVNNMIKKESVARRVEGENGISFTEFSYTLLQGYDYFYLNQEKKCDLQIGGSDQWGNIVSGVELIRRKTGKESFGITVPLLVDKNTGRKFGKSEGNSVWLDPEKTSPYEFYQFWLNSNDENSIEYLKLFTIMSLEEIKDIENEMKNYPEQRMAQKSLAYEVTKFVHGEELAGSIKKIAEILFSGEGTNNLNEDEKELLLKEAPSFNVYEDMSLVDILVDSKLASSKREAREFIENGAVSVDNDKVTDTMFRLNPKLTTNTIAILKRGKKNKIILSF